MKAQFLSQDGEDSIIRVDAELLQIITPQAGLTIKPGQELRLHDYIPRAREYSGALREFKAALGTLLKLSTGDTP